MMSNRTSPSVSNTPVNQVDAKADTAAGAECRLPRRRRRGPAFGPSGPAFALYSSQVGVNVKGSQYVPGPSLGHPGPLTVKVRSPEKLPSPFGAMKSDLVVVTVLPSLQWKGYSEVDSQRPLTHWKSKSAGAFEFSVNSVSRSQWATQPDATQVVVKLAACVDGSEKSGRPLNVCFEWSK
jgi:hypothetical protein